MTVRQAIEAYTEAKRSEGKAVDDLISRTSAHVLPTLGEIPVAELSTARLRRWLANLAATPAQARPKANGKPNYRPAPADDAAIRRRRSSANRVLTMLKAALNFALDEGHVASNVTWGRKLKPFRSVDAARVRYLQIAEAQRLINGSDPDFRDLVTGALETGMRYGELIRLEVADFNPDTGTVLVRKSKTGKPRHVTLTAAGAAFFRRVCAGRAGSERLFLRSTGDVWGRNDQHRSMRAAIERASIDPPITFHGLRHTWASHAVMNGVPLMVVAKNLGHKDTRMVEHFYGHLAPSHIADAIRAGAPNYGVKLDDKVVPLEKRREKGRETF